MPSVGEQQHHAIDAEISCFRRCSPLELLEITEVRFRLDEDGAPGHGENPVAAPPIAGDRDRNLGSERDFWRQPSTKSIKEGRVGLVADVVAVGKERRG